MACANIFISYISTSGHILLWVYLETPKCGLDQYNRAFILNPKHSNFTSKDQQCNPHHQIWSVQRTPQKHICEEVNSQTQFLDLISLYQKRKEKLTRGDFGFDSSLFVKTTAKRLLAWEQHYTQPKPHSVIFTSGFAQNRKKKMSKLWNSILFPPCCPTIQRCPSVLWPHVEGVGCPSACWYWTGP